MSRVELASVANGTIVNLQNELLPGASAMVYQHGTTTQVPVWTSETSNVSILQPLCADVEGKLPGWCDGPAKVDIVVQYTGQTFPAAETDIVPAESVIAAQAASDPLGAATVARNQAMVLAIALGG